VVFEIGDRAEWVIEDWVELKWLGDYACRGIRLTLSHLALGWGGFLGIVDRIWTIVDQGLSAATRSRSPAQPGLAS
jgi:hypothetical protein